MTRRGAQIIPWWMGAFVCATVAGAQPESPPTNAPFHVVSPGVLELGKVRLDQSARTATFPAVLNLDHGPMEYFLVTTYGKTHESILKTEASPYDIHLAMVLLGARGSGGDHTPGAPPNGVPGPIIHPSKDPVPGDKVSIDVRWQRNGGEVRRAAGELVYNTETRATLDPAAWAYNGSLVVRGKFLAQSDGSIVSLVTDPVALVNNNAPGHDNDEIWQPNTNNLPPPGEPVEVAITLLPKTP